jgi:hypothetical protein
VRVASRAHAVEDAGRTHDRDDDSYHHGHQFTAPCFCLSLDFHVLLNSLLAGRQPDVGPQSAYTIKLGFNPCDSRGACAPIKGI